MKKLQKKEAQFLATVRGPGEKAVQATITLKFLASPTMSKDLELIGNHLFALVDGSLQGLTMPTKRIPTRMEVGFVDLPCRNVDTAGRESCRNTTDNVCGFCDECCGHARGICAKEKS